MHRTCHHITVIALFLDMGMGKTVITPTAVEKLLYDCFLASKILIVAPKKVAETTWDSEALKWEHLKDLQFSMIMGDVMETNLYRNLYPRCQP